MKARKMRSITLMVLFFVTFFHAFSSTQVLAANADISTTLASFTASNTDIGLIGGSLASAGDVDGDGYDDFLIGAPSGSGDFLGSVYLVYGGANGITDVDVSTAVKFTAQSGLASAAGAAVAAAGDVNNDGYDDFLIGATSGSGGNYTRGSAYLFYGQAARYTSRNISTANVIFTMRTQVNYGDSLGAALASAGDMDSDGYDDFLISAPNHNGYKGSVFLVYGRSIFASTMVLEDYSVSAGLTTITVPTGVIRFDGTAVSDIAGTSIDGNADVDGDGKPDLIIGVPNTENNGSAYFISGADVIKNTMSQESLDVIAHIEFTGENLGDEAGISVSFGGDMNGDGKSELLIGARYYVNDLASPNANRGIVYVWQGATVATISASTVALSTADIKYIGERVTDAVGALVDSAGDVNGDGKADVMLGTSLNDGGSGNINNNVGAVYVLYGSATLGSGSINLSNYTNPSYNLIKFTGQTSGTIGGLFAAGGHLNNDSYDDMIVLSSYAIAPSTERSIFMVSGSAALTSALLPTGSTTIIGGEPQGGKTGSSVAAVGDVNNDGYNDFITGATYDMGRAYLVLGGGLSTTNLDQTVRFTGESAGDQAGFSAAAAGDMNGDGFDDFLVGAPYENSGGADAGAVYLVYGSATPTSKNLSHSSIKKFTGQAAGDHAGWAVGSIADLNSDALPEVIIGAPASSSNAGKVYIIFSTSIISTGLDDFNLANADTIITGAANDQLGYALSTLTDISGDTKSEMLMGAPSNSANPGSVYLLYSSSVIGGAMSVASSNVKFIGETANDQAGFSVSSAGDANDDGLPDIIIGAPRNAATRGAVYLVYGSTSFASTINLTTAHYKFTGENTETSSGAGDGGKAGYAVAAAGDLNNDGVADLLVGAPLPSNSGTTSTLPAAYYISGTTLNSSISVSTTLALSDSTIVKIYSSESVEQTGLAVAAVPDIYNTRNRSAIFIGAPCGNRQDICTGVGYYGFPYSNVDADPSDYIVSGFSGVSDCDDAVATTYPGAPELCDTVDNNCDDNADEGLTQYTTYPDGDGDAYGDGSVLPTTSCIAVGFQVANNTDCVDTNSTINPGAAELCNAVDDNCNSIIDENVKTTYYHDADGDGYGDSNAPMLYCTTSVPVDYVANATDCNDNDSTIHPGATDIAGDGIDQDCSGSDAVVSAPTPAPTPVPTPTSTDTTEPDTSSSTSTTTDTNPNSNTTTPGNSADCSSPNKITNVQDQTIAYTTGTKAKKKYRGFGKKLGIVKAYNSSNQLVRCWESFPKGGVKARLHKKYQQHYVFSIKYRSGTSLRVHSSDTGTQIIKQRLSPQMHRRKLRIGELDGRKKTIEIVTSVRRGRMIYIKVHSFNTANQTMRLVKRKSIKNTYGKRYRLALTQSAVKLSHGKRSDLLRWQPWL